LEQLAYDLHLAWSEQRSPGCFLVQIALWRVQKSRAVFCKNIFSGF
jgi:hypothetical protein